MIKTQIKNRVVGSGHGKLSWQSFDNDWTCHNSKQYLKTQANSITLLLWGMEQSSGITHAAMMSQKQALGLDLSYLVLECHLIELHE